MCRLAAWLGSELALEDIIVKPPHSLIEQSQHATEAKLAVNGDGFGFTWYNKAGRLGKYKAILPAWADPNLISLAAMIKSRVFLAHIRASTFGQVSRNNCHPFTSGRWCFAHNGQIADFGNYRRHLEASLSDSRYCERNGNTDSELLFLLLLDHGLNEDVHTAWHSVLKLVKQAAGGSKKATRIAAVFSDGERLFALRHSSDSRSPTLYFCRKPEGGLVIASEPLDDGFDLWKPVPESTLIIADTSEVSHYLI